jgi:hypothetical protein
MKPTDSVPGSFVLQTHFKRFGFVAGPLALLMLLAMSAAAQTEFGYTNDNGRITITKYTGSGGAVIIPETIDGGCWYARYGSKMLNCR